MDLIREYWWVIVIVVALVLAFILLRPKQRVTADRQRAGSPAHGSNRRRAKAADSRARPRRRRATSPARSSARPSIARSKATYPRDDLCLLKGVGPKFADALHAARLLTISSRSRSSSPAEIERLDQQLGAFSGRITRDRIVEQADYLARNDTDGFEQRFGKL